MLHCEYFLFVLSLFNPFCFDVLGQKKKKSFPSPTPVFLFLVISLFSVHMLSSL